MEVLWNTFGHSQAKTMLEAQLSTSNFSHAYLLQGPEGVGKRQLALEFAGKILETPHAETHPDFAFLEVDSKEEMGVEALRSFISKLSTRPFVGSHTVAIINNAHLLNAHSSNALLKTLEEPSPSTIIILVASHQMLPTVMSRCQLLRFNAFTEPELAMYAHTRALAVSPASLALAQGSIGKLQWLVDNQKQAEQMQKRIEHLVALSSKTMADRILAITEFSELEIEDLKQIFMGLLFVHKQQLPSKLQYFLKMRAILEAQAHLIMHMNKKLVLQKLFLQL